MIKAVMIAGLLLVVSSSATGQSSERRTSAARPAVTGAFIDTADGRGTFSGNLAFARFEARQGFLVAIGTLTGTLADSTGDIVGRVSKEVEMPVVVMTATCELLHLDLEPLDVDLLGQQVHLEKGALGITTRDGTGRGFGNLLCSTARLRATATPETLATNLNAVLSAMER